MSGLPPAQLLAHLRCIDQLTDEEVYVLAQDSEFWLRDDQILPATDWRYLTLLGGRGLGKTTAICSWINDEVWKGRIRRIALLAQDEDQTVDKQALPLIEASPPWNRASTYRNTVQWENGAKATIYTPQSPDAIRGGNLDLAWLSEVVGWGASHRWDAFTTVVTATRDGVARVIVDTTPRGRNEVIRYLLDLNEEDPEKYPILRGTIYDNPLLSREYLREQYRMYSGRRRAEELEGQVFDELEGAAYQDTWIRDHRIFGDVPALEVKIAGVDPAITSKKKSDATGIVIAGRANDGHIYVLKDLSDRHSPEAWADLIIKEHERGVTGVVIETNRGGDAHVAVLRARCQIKNVDLRVLGREQRMPTYTCGVLYVRETRSYGNKLERAYGPAALYEAGEVHHVGEFAELEEEQTTYTGDGESPNRYDALNIALAELASLGGPRRGERPRGQAAKPVFTTAMLNTIRDKTRVREDGRSF